MAVLTGALVNQAKEQFNSSDARLSYQLPANKIPAVTLCHELRFDEWKQIIQHLSGLISKIPWGRDHQHLWS